jgi:microcin C transport system substrate-binding protein
MCATRLLGRLAGACRLANFDRITIKIYKDNTARLEALKAGEFDLMRINSAGDWARRLTGGALPRASWSRARSRTSCPRAFRAFS